MRLGHIRLSIIFAVLAFALSLDPATGRADVFVLATGGEIRGELVNVDESPRKQYVIRAYAGGSIAIAAERVTSVVKQQPTEVAYDRIRLEHDDSVEGHWRLAEWCRENRLPARRRFHLKRVVQMDRDHAEARRRLGYEKVHGEWLTRDEIMQARGYVEFNGRWMLPQAVQIMKEKKVQKELEKEWYERIRRYSGWLDSGKREQGKEHILAIRSPHAVASLVKQLERAKQRPDKEVYAQALSNIGTGTAMATLVASTIEDSDEDFRYFCLDLLEKAKPAVAVKKYIKALKSKDNRELNRAAVGLARMEDKAAIEPLIDALITSHKYVLGKDNPGAMSLGFGGPVGNQSSGFATGGSAKAIIRNHRNEDVLLALSELTGKDFDFDVSAWNFWHASQQPAQPKINSRRDN